MGKNCLHTEKEAVIEYHGLKVEKCANCRYIFALDPTKAHLLLYNNPQTALKRIREEMSGCIRGIDGWMKTNVSPSKYSFWKEELVGKVKWHLIVQKRGAHNYLLLLIIDPSMSRIEHKKKSGNTRTTRSLGTVSNLSDVDGVLEMYVKYAGWKKIEKFLEGVVRAL